MSNSFTYLSILEKNQILPYQKKHLRCSFCGAKEGEKHPLRQFKVELRPIIGEPKGDPACQVCRIHFRAKPKKFTKSQWKTRLRKIAALFTAFVFTPFYSGILLAYTSFSIFAIT